MSVLGARRTKRGKHADEGEKAKAKLIIGVLLLVLLIGATMVLILTSLPETSEAANPSNSAGLSDPNISLPGEEDVTILPDLSEPSAPETPPTPSESADVEIAEVIITAFGGPIKDNDFTLKKVGDSIQLSFKTIPESTGKKAEWKSSDEDVFMVTSDGKVTATGRGSATLTVTVDGIPTKCIVRVKSA